MSFQIFSVKGLGKHYVHQTALCLPSNHNVLPSDVSPEYPGYACILGNLLEAAAFVLSDPKLASDTVSVFLLLLFFFQF